jgi:hypothetical protein
MHNTKMLSESKNENLNATIREKKQDVIMKHIAII